ncbi:MAG: hypothetical protein RIQ93_2377 [Verrucomicrobiota bacterium]|jgi:hypothetical protein
MNLPLVSIFYVLVWLAAGWLALLCLGDRLRGKSARARRVLLPALGAIMLLFLLVPVGGLPGWSRAFSFWTNPSLPLLGLIAVALWHRLTPVRVFRSEDWRGAWIFGAVAGFVLYIPPLVGGTIDLYFWGWDSRVAILGLTGLTVAFVAAGRRMGVLILGSLMAYSIDALESRNGWDYLIDPVYWMISLGWLGARGIRLGLGRGSRGAAGKTVVAGPTALADLSAKP